MTRRSPESGSAVPEPVASNLGPMQLINRPEVVWLFGYVRLGILFLYLALPVALVLVLLAKTPTLAWVIPVALCFVAYLDYSTLLDPVHRIVLDDPLTVQRIVRTQTLPLVLLRQIEISLRDNLDYAEREERTRKFVVRFVFHDRRPASITIGIRGLTYLQDWADARKLNVVNLMTADEMRD
jgi:hypothetical protein